MKMMIGKERVLPRPRFHLGISFLVRCPGWLSFLCCFCVSSSISLLPSLLLPRGNNVASPTTPRRVVCIFFVSVAAALVYYVCVCVFLLSPSSLFALPPDGISSRFFVPLFAPSPSVDVGGVGISNGGTEYPLLPPEMYRRREEERDALRVVCGRQMRRLRIDDAPPERELRRVCKQSWRDAKSEIDRFSVLFPSFFSVDHADVASQPR